MTTALDLDLKNFKPALLTERNGPRGFFGVIMLPPQILTVWLRNNFERFTTGCLLIDGESTLKTFVADKGKPHLRAENPKYPKLFPAGELVIQGVMVALIRKRK